MLRIRKNHLLYYRLVLRHKAARCICILFVLQLLLRCNKVKLNWKFLQTFCQYYNVIPIQINNFSGCVNTMASLWLTILTNITQPNFNVIFYVPINSWEKRRRTCIEILAWGNRREKENSLYQVVGDEMHNFDTYEINNSFHEKFLSLSCFSFVEDYTDPCGISASHPCGAPCRRRLLPDECGYECGLRLPNSKLWRKFEIKGEVRWA